MTDVFQLGKKKREASRPAPHSLPPTVSLSQQPLFILLIQ